MTIEWSVKIQATPPPPVTCNAGHKLQYSLCRPNDTPKTTFFAPSTPGPESYVHRSIGNPTATLCFLDKQAATGRAQVREGD